jgi:carboxyl-terminal processing protease
MMAAIWREFPALGGGLGALNKGLDRVAGRRDAWGRLRHYNFAMQKGRERRVTVRWMCVWLAILAAGCAAAGWGGATVHASAAAAARGGQAAAGDAGALTADESRAIVEAAWQDVHDKFYDPKFRGVDWDAVHAQYVQRAAAVHDRNQAEALVREMIGLLHNSHSGVMTHAELDWMKNELPFFFERVNGRTFVSHVLATHGDATDVGVRFGDEIVTVDGQPAAALRMIAVRWLMPVLSDPYYGAAGSTATVGLRRDGRALTVKVKRVRRDAVEPVFAEQYGPVGYVRLLSLTAATVPPEALRQAMDKVDGSKGIILDLRDCVGGDAPDADGLGGMLLGAGVKLATGVTRAGTETVENTVDFGPVYKGRVVVLVNGQTASEPEMLTAALKEYGRVTVVGTRTRGAFNGFTEGMGLPDGAGILVVPIDRGVSPQGKEYEGVGVTPDVTVENSIRDFRAGRDRAMETALRLAAVR